MSDNMSDMINNLNDMLKGNTVPDNLKDMLNSVMNNSSNNTSNASTNTDNSNNNSSNDFSNIDINTILKMQEVMKSINSEQSSSRVKLLRSLKPYLKPSRQDKVEQYIQLFNMEKIFEMFNNKNDGGGKN